MLASARQRQEQEKPGAGGRVGKRAGRKGGRKAGSKVGRKAGRLQRVPCEDVHSSWLMSISHMSTCACAGGRGMDRWEGTDSFLHLLALLP